MRNPSEVLLMGSEDGTPLFNHGTRFAPIRQTGGAAHTIPYYWNPDTLAFEIATQGGSGVGQEVKVTNFPGTQAVSVASLPLPTGASTAAHQVTAQATLTNMNMVLNVARTAFGWLRTADPVTIFDQPGFRYGKETLLWSDVVTGTGATTHNANAGVITISTGGTASGAKVRRATRQYYRYQAGKGQLIMQSLAFGAADANVVRRVGVFDAACGIYLKEQNGALSLVIRSSADGSVGETTIPQASWNGDVPTLVLDGRTLLMGLAYEWLGVGRVMLILADPATGELWVAHDESNVNKADYGALPYMETASLPVAFEIENVGVAGGTRVMTQICTSVISEGGWEEGRGLTFQASNGITTIGVTTRRPVLSIRPALLVGGVTNRALYDIIHHEITASSNSSFWELVYNGTLTGASFSAVDATYSGMEKDVAATAITGGVVIESGFAISGSGPGRDLVDNQAMARLPFGLDQAGSVQDILTLVCTSFTGTSNIAASIHWRETR